jgi:predicted RNA-binding Zn ribbon-like protein
MVYVQTVHHIFKAHDLVSGHVAIDLANTVTARKAEPSDWLSSYDALIGWAAHTGQFSKGDLVALSELARRDPVGARAALTRMKLLREALCRVLYAIVAEDEPKRSDLAEIDKARVAAASAAKLAMRGGAAQTAWTAKDSGLDMIGHVVVSEALELLRDEKLARLRICDGDHCGWLFLDLSKNASRRWCDMATCGNVAKARRFQKRRRKAKVSKRRIA